MSHSAPQAPGRRTAAGRGRRVNVTTMLAVALPVVCALALVLVRPSGTTEETTAPTSTALTRATLVCPSAMAGTPDLAITSSSDGVRGPVRVGLGDARERVDIAAGEVTTVSGDPGPVAVLGEDETAPGLVAARFGADGSAATSCSAPAPQAWFTGVGAGAGHTSVLELANPDPGTAVADVTVYGRRGVVNAPKLRGVSVSGGSSVRLDLASVIPRRDELAIQVVATRGRIGATVLDRYDQLGAAALTEDWLPHQAEPATENLLMGLAPGTGRRTLVVANSGEDQVRAEVKLVTEDSVFTPKALPEIKVAPQSVQHVSLSSLLASPAAEGAIGILVTGSQPVTATLRSYVDGDLSDTAPGDLLDAPSTVLLPEGGGAGKTVELAGARRAGVVTVVARSASGRELDRTRAEITPDRGVSVKLPADTALVTVTPERTTVSGAVLVAGDGATVVPLTVPATHGLVPAVHPGLP